MKMGRVEVLEREHSVHMTTHGRHGDWGLFGANL